MDQGLSNRVQEQQPGGGDGDIQTDINWLSTRERGKSCFVVFTNFHGVNTRGRANFKGLKNWLAKFLQIPIIGFDEPVRASSSRPRLWVSIRELARQHPYRGRARTGLKKYVRSREFLDSNNGKGPQSPRIIPRHSSFVLQHRKPRLRASSPKHTESKPEPGLGGGLRLLRITSLLLLLCKTKSYLSIIVYIQSYFG